MSAAFSGHQTISAAETVRAFLDSRPPTYPERLRGKMLQAADDLFRAARVVEGWRGQTPALVPER
jgi:aminopeptidase N